MRCFADRREVGPYESFIIGRTQFAPTNAKPNEVVLGCSEAL